MGHGLFTAVCKTEAKNQTDIPLTATKSPFCIISVIHFLLFLLLNIDIVSYCKIIGRPMFILLLTCFISQKLYYQFFKTSKINNFRCTTNT